MTHTVGVRAVVIVIITVFLTAAVILVLPEDGRAALSGMPWWHSGEVTAITALALPRLGPPPLDPTNRVSGDPRAAALGARLFSDRRLSATGTVACASCHQPTRGFQDGVALATGVGTGARRTMSVLGVWSQGEVGG